jgi:hypothetical protein
MATLASVLGQLIGAILKTCGPQISDIIAAAIRKAFNDTIEEGSVNADLRARLAARVRDANRSREAGRSGEDQADNAG